MPVSSIISRWTSPSQPAPELFVSEQPPHEPERRKKLLLRRLYDLLPDDAQVRLRTNSKTHVSQMAVA